MKNNKYILIFVVLAVLVLWQLLLPGYVLTQDMIFAPEMTVVPVNGGLANSLPVDYLLYFSSLIIPAWFLQKIILFVLFFLLFYLPFKYLEIRIPNCGIHKGCVSPGESSEFARFITAVFYAVNPFVYARFLAGHWTHLYAYAFLPVFISYLFDFFEIRDFKSAGKLFGVLFLIGLFSPQFLAMSAMILIASLGMLFLKTLSQARRRERDAFSAEKDSRGSEKIIFTNSLLSLVKNILIAGVIFLIASSYWIVPAILRENPIEQNFGQSQWKYFSASGATNALTLNGFWGEKYNWANYFSWPQNHALFWFAFVVMVVVMIIGLFHTAIRIPGCRIHKGCVLPGDGLLSHSNTHSWPRMRIAGIPGKAQPRLGFVFFLVIAFFAFIFSTGAGDTIFKNFNLWFYNHVPFWGGFRDSQKFAGYLALSYAVFIGWGITAVEGFLSARKKVLTDIFRSTILILVVLIGMFVWGGFQRQLKSVWYPDVWRQTKNVLTSKGVQDGAGVLILPWHGYFSLKFNNNLITSNPGKKFFGNSVVINEAIEMDDVYVQDNQAAGMNEIDNAIRGDFDPDDAVEFLKTGGIKYIIYFQELIGKDNLDYSFLDSLKIKKILEDKDVILYEL